MSAQYNMCGEISANFQYRLLFLARWIVLGMELHSFHGTSGVTRFGYTNIGHTFFINFYSYTIIQYTYIYIYTQRVYLITLYCYKGTY